MSRKLFARRTIMMTVDNREDRTAARLEASLTFIVEPDRRTDDWLTVALEDSFPCSDPLSSMRSD
jgi:hypothetical protein